MSAVLATLVGNLVADPELSKTPSGKVFLRFTIATNERYRDSAGEWKDHPASFWKCEAWNDQAEAIAENFTKGAPMIVIGPFRTQTWKNEQGESRTRQFVKVEAVGANVLVRRQVKEASEAEAPAAVEPADDWAAQT